MNQYESDIVSYNVATLNYSSSIVSPYQFHENLKQDLNLFEFQLDEAFQSFALKQFPNFNDPNFKWGMTSLDFSWKNRFSPFYLQDCGVGPNEKMMNEQEFLKQWNKQSEKAKYKIIEDEIQRLVIKGTKLSNQEITANIQLQISSCRIYDLIGYRAFLKVIYGVQDIKNIDLNADKYKNIRQKHFSKPYITEQIKREKALQMIEARAYDIFCLQQCSKEFTRYLQSHIKSYLVVQMPNRLSKICDSIILLKKTKFPNYTAEKIEDQRIAFLNQFADLIKNPNPSKFSKKLSTEVVNYFNQKANEYKDIQIQDSVMKIHKQLFWNDDTCYAVVGPLIIFSPHISTKVNLNWEQINNIKKILVKIITYFPEKYFICAGDLNGQFESQLNFETADNRFVKVNAFPYHNDDITCYKMRTLTQAQRNKALEVSFCKKDYIITDLRLYDQVIIMADGTPVNKGNAHLLPNERHPFDHFIVSAEVRLTDRIESKSPLVRKKPVSSPFEGFSLDYAPDRNI